MRSRVGDAQITLGPWPGIYGKREFGTLGTAGHLGHVGHWDSWLSHLIAALMKNRRFCDTQIVNNL